MSQQSKIEPVNIFNTFQNPPPINQITQNMSNAEQYTLPNQTLQVSKFQSNALPVHQINPSVHKSFAIPPPHIMPTTLSGNLGTEWKSPNEVIGTGTSFIKSPNSVNNLTNSFVNIKQSPNIRPNSIINVPRPSEITFGGQSTTNQTQCVPPGITSFNTYPTSGLGTTPTPVSSQNHIPIAPAVNVQNQKQQYLAKLERLRKKGITLSNTFTMNSSLAEIEDEFIFLKKENDITKNVKLQKNALMSFGSFVEAMNSYMNPFDIRLDSWSESVFESIDDYDDIFEEIHEKHGDFNIPPELKLIFKLLMSAVFFHVSKIVIDKQMTSANVSVATDEEMKTNARQTAETLTPNIFQQIMSTMNSKGGLAEMLSGNLIPQEAPVSQTTNPPINQQW